MTGNSQPPPTSNGAEIRHVGNATEYQGFQRLTNAYFSAIPPDIPCQIKEQGQGIPPDRLESIFERFYQVNDAGSQNKGGIRLGLVIYRQIIEQHSGKIWADSKLDQSGIFYVKPPASKA